MRSLFLRIFVWFWLAMALVVLAYGLSTRMVLDEGPKHFLGGQLEMYGMAVAEKYEQEGEAGADSYLAMLERSTRTRGYLFDENANRIAGREPSPKVAEMAQSLVGHGSDGFTQTPRTDFVARKIDAPRGGRFIVVGENPRPPGIGLPFWPRVWWAQSIAVFLTAGFFCYGLARYISAPVVRLRAATRQLAAGDFSARVSAASHRRRDELADLGRDFDVMAERIQSLMASQHRLLHDISHELRSPLARLKIALELARQGDGEEARWALERIEREADRLNSLIGQLLTLAQLDRDTPIPDGAPVDLERLVEDVVLDADFEARSSNRAAKVISSQGCLVTGNKELLRSAIENVVRNAVSYTAEGTTVEISLHCEDDADNTTAVVSVLDRGDGVPQAELSDIFQPFYRIADSRDRKSGGVGLGLSISQRAVQVHGGTIRASNAPVRGLLVEIRLPSTRQQVIICDHTPAHN